MMDALIGLLFKGIKPAVLTWYRDRTGIAQKMHHLEMLVAKVRSVTEVYKKAKIKNDHLHKLQDMFDKAATEGEEVLRKLPNQVDSSSSSSAVSLFERIFSRDENVEELNRTLEQMEDVSANVKDFLKTLKLELSNLVEQRKRPQDIHSDWLCFGHYREPTASRGRHAHSTSSVEENSFLAAKKARLSPTNLHSPPRPEIGPWMNIKSPEGMPNNLAADISQANAVNSEEQATLRAGYGLDALPIIRNELQGDAVNSKEQELRRAFCELGALPRIQNELQADAVYSKEESLSKDYVHDALHTMQMELQPASLPKFLTIEQIEQVTAADRLVTELLVAVDKVEQQGKDDSWFSQWITKLKAAIEEGTCVVSAIKSNNYCVNHHIFDEVGVILTAVCQKLGSMRNELDDFSDLAEAEKLTREYTALRDARSNKNSLTLSL